MMEIKKKIRSGRRVQISDGSGVDSGKQGTVVCSCKITVDGFGIPTNVLGAYKPPDWKREVAIFLDEGRYTTMFKNHITAL